MELEKGPASGVPSGAKLIRPIRKIEDPLTDEERAKFEGAIGPAPAAFPPGAAPQALVIEDDPQMRSLLVTLIKPWDLDVFDVATGTEALKALATRRVDFMIVDLKIPGFDGFEVIRCARSYIKLRQTEIIVISGAVDPKDEVAALNLGADSYIRKPVTNELLQARLKPMVRRLYDRLGG